MKIQSDIQGRLLLHLSQDRLVRDSSGNCECRKNFHHKDQGDGAANKKEYLPDGVKGEKLQWKVSQEL